MEEKELTFKSLFFPFTTVKAIAYIIISGFLVYCNGFFNNFVGDDQGQVIDNSLVHSILNIPTFFQSSTFFNGDHSMLIGNYFRPLMLTFFAIIYNFFGPNYVAFHFFQFIFQILNVILLFLLLKYFIKSIPAFLLSLIFLVHPINSEVVLYISDSQEILFFFFGMLSLYLLLKYKLQKYPILPILFLLLSMFSKETGVLFFLLAVAFTFLFKRKYLLSISVWGGVSVVIYLLFRIHAVGLFSNPANSTIARFSLPIRLLNIPEMFLYYFKTFFFPLDLSSSYQWVYTRIDLLHFVIPFFIDAIIIVVILYPVFLFWKKKSKYFNSYLFFVFWFFIGMLIHMQVISLDATVAEGWFYFPMVGLLGMMGLAYESFNIKAKEKWLIIIVLVLIIALSVRTIVRSFDWKDELTIAMHDVKVSKDSWGLENELSFSYFQKGMYLDAKIHAEKSIALHPFLTNYMNLGAAEFYLKDYKNAKEAFLNSIKFGDYYQNYVNLAFLGLYYGDHKQSMDFIQNKALKKFPNNAKLWTFLAILEYNFGDKDKAKLDIQNAYILSKDTQTVSVYNAIRTGLPVRTGAELK
jgi:protein O-mannosyl-transferase